jgi:hypothetical protein
VEVSIPLIQQSILHRYSQAFAAADKKTIVKPLTVKEMRDLTLVITSLDKLLRLDAGLPTAVHEHQLPAFAPISLEELRAVVSEDQMCGLIPLKASEYREVKEPETEGKETLDGQPETPLEGGDPFT